MADAFVSLAAIQPLLPTTSTTGGASTASGTVQPRPPTGIYGTVRNIGVKTK